MRVLLAPLFALALVQSSQVAFTIPERDLIPEGIAFDAQTKQFFVGSTFKRKIVAIDAAGKPRDFVTEARDGVFGFVGLRVDPVRRELWAISSNAGDGMPARGLDASCLGCSMVTVYDIRSGRTLRTYRLPNTPARHFLNDLVVVSSGDAYITDSMTNEIYRVLRGRNQIERWIGLGPGESPNGIDATPNGRTLFVGTEVGIRGIDVATGKVTPLSEALGTIDGLYFFDNALIAIRPFEEGKALTRFRLSPGRDAIVKTEILDATHRAHRQPTTGVVVGPVFYYIANAQLQWFRGLYQNGKYDPSTLADVVILRRSLQ